MKKFYIFPLIGLLSRVFAGVVVMEKASIPDESNVVISVDITAEEIGAASKSDVTNALDNVQYLYNSDRTMRLSASGVLQECEYLACSYWTNTAGEVWTQIDQTHWQKPGSDRQLVYVPRNTYWYFSDAMDTDGFPIDIYRGSQNVTYIPAQLYPETSAFYRIYAGGTMTNWVDATTQLVNNSRVVAGFSLSGDTYMSHLKIKDSFGTQLGDYNGHADVTVALPEGTLAHSLFLTNGVVKTKSGTQITAAQVGALSNSYTAPVRSVNSKTGAVTLTASDVNAVPVTRTVNSKGLSSDIVLDASDVSAYPASSGNTLAMQVSTIGAHLNTEDARFVSTNYDSVVHIPEAYVEINVTDENTGSNGWITVWREMTRWNAFTGLDFDWDAWVGFYSWKTNVDYEISMKADRAWGCYDSETGEYSPAGYTQVSSSNILIASGMSYKRVLTTDGAVWILQCNGGHAVLNGDTNGVFRITDSEGTAHFEIIKGDDQELGADADGITIDSVTKVVTIPYSVEANDHPTLEVALSLDGTPVWKGQDDSDCPFTVVWSGTSGSYTATLTPKSTYAQAFVRAKYIAGGETYIRNNTPVSMDSIMLNGVKYYIGVGTNSTDNALYLKLSRSRIY